MELLQSTWPWRVGIGLGLLAVFAVVDLVRHPRNPTRIKEYGFLFAVTGATMAYGLLHDLFTYSISPEYFAVGKGLGAGADSFFPEVAALALKASWSAGLFIGLTLLIANNPSKRRPQLPYCRLARAVAVPLIAALVAATIVGLSVRTTSDRLSMLLRIDDLGLSDQAAFVTVWCIHLGTYAGALVGVFGAAVLVRCERRRLLRCERRRVTNLIQPLLAVGLVGAILAAAALLVWSFVLH
jgi:hypothetical protein